MFGVLEAINALTELQILYLMQLGVNKPSVITCAAQLLKVLGVDDLTEGSFIPPNTRSYAVEGETGLFPQSFLESFG
jgi:hypothetical protein